MKERNLIWKILVWVDDDRLKLFVAGVEIRVENLLLALRDSIDAKLEN